MEEQIKTAPQTDVEVVDIQFRSGQKIYFFDPDGQRFADGMLWFSGALMGVMESRGGKQE